MVWSLVHHNILCLVKTCSFFLPSLIAFFLTIFFCVVACCNVVQRSTYLLGIKHVRWDYWGFSFWGATINHVERKNLTLKTNFKKRCHTAWNRNAEWLIRNVQQEMCATWVGNGEFKSELCALLYIMYCKSIIHPQLEKNW